MSLLTIPWEKSVQLKYFEVDERRRKFFVSKASVLTEDYEHLC
jgi:hypothetical protein